MPDQNETPDFDRMTQEEILKWIESLPHYHHHARVGGEALPGWDDAQNVSSSINPDDYVPYGMTKEA